MWMGSLSSTTSDIEALATEYRSQRMGRLGKSEGRRSAVLLLGTAARSRSPLVARTLVIYRRDGWQEAHGGEVPAELLQPAAVAAADGGHGKAMALLQGAGASLPETALARALARAAAKQQEADVMALLALQAPPAGEAGGEGRAKWEKGDLVVLRPGLEEKKGLKAGEVAAVSYGPDSEGDYRVRRVSDGEKLSWFKAADFVTPPTTPLRVAAGTGSVPIVSAILAKLKACGVGAAACA